MWTEPQDRPENCLFQCFAYVSADSDREDPAAESRTGGLVVAPKQMSSALGSLVANYGSLSESESDEEPESECLSYTQ